MSKALVQIRDGIDDVYSDLVESNDGGVLSVKDMLASVRQKLAHDIEWFETELINASLERLIHDVGRRRGRRRSNDEVADLFEGYKRIPRTLLVKEGARKSTAKMTISELETYLDDHTPRSVANDHEEMRRLITDCRKYVKSERDTFEVLLRRQAEASHSD